MGREYAVQQAGSADNLDSYNKAYKHYMDSIGEEPVYMGYTFNEVQKWGVGLGLDLKGGMNVILQVNMSDMLKSMSRAPEDPVLNQAINLTDSIIKAHPNEDYIATFVDRYNELDPQADFSVVFSDVVKNDGRDLSSVKGKLKSEIQDRVNTSATNVLRNRIDSYGVVSPNIQVLQGKDGQILLELPGVKEHERVRDLLQRSANLEFYETYTMAEISNAFRQLDDAMAANDSTYQGLGSLMSFYGEPSTPRVALAPAANRDAIDAILNSPTAKSILPANLKLRWSVKPEDPSMVGGRKDLYTLVALKAEIDPATHQPRARMTGDCIIAAQADYENLKGNVVSMVMNSEGARQWANLTRQNIGKAVAILLDDQVYSYPNVNTAIEGGRSEITGTFTVEEARDLANVLKSGKMTARVEIISDMVVGPTLGKQAIHDGFMSFIIALILLMVFMISIYGVIPGLVANLGLVFNIFFTFGILASFQAVLTLSGIAGIVLALGMGCRRQRAHLRARQGGTPCRQECPHRYSRRLQQRFLGHLRLQPHLDNHRPDPAALRHRPDQGLRHHADHRYRLLVLHRSLPDPHRVHRRSQVQGFPETHILDQTVRESVLQHYLQLPRRA